jgi:hypothetical protein
MSAWNSGRDVVFQLSNPKVQELMLRNVRLSPTLACLAGSGGARPAWPTAVELRPDDDRIQVTVTTPDEPETVSLPLTLLEPYVQTPLGFLDVLGTPGSPALRFVDGGAIAAGLDLSTGTEPDETRWTTFRASILGAHDWAIAIDAPVLLQFVTAKLDEFHTTVNADRAQVFFVSATRARWGNRVRVEIDVISRATRDVAGLVDIAAAGTIVATVRFVVERPAFRLRLELLDALVLTGDDRRIEDPELFGPYEYRPQPGDPPAADHPVFGRLFMSRPERAARRREFYRRLRARLNPDQFFPPVPLRFGGRGDGFYLGTRVIQDEAGLRLLGALTAVEAPPEPRIAVDPVEVLFVEDVPSACVGGTPRFGFPTLRIRNYSNGPLRLCRADVIGDPGFMIISTSDPNVQVVNNGRGLVNPSGSPVSSSGFQLVLGYQGSRDRSASATLRIASNDPSHWTTDVALRALATVTPTVTVDPEQVVITVANTRDGQSRVAVYDCREHVPRQQAPQDPSATVTVRNTGPGPAYLCDVLLLDNPGVFVLDPVEAGALLPDESRRIGIRFFPTDVLVDYSARLELRLNAGAPLSVPISARVDPEARRMRLGVGLRGADLEHILVDLAGDALCLPSDPDLCRAHGYFQPVDDPRVRRVGMMVFGPTPPPGEVVIRDPAGEPLVRDFSGDSRRRISVEFSAPGAPDQPPYNPCIADYAGFRSGEIELLRVQLSGRLLLPVTDLGLDGVRALAARGGWAYVGTPHGVEVVDWDDPTAPRRAGRLDVPDVTALSLLDGVLVVAAGDEVLGFDLAPSGQPIRRAAVAIGGPVRTIAARHRFVYAVDGTHLVTLELREDRLDRLARQTIPGGAGQLELVAGRVCVAGPERLTVLTTGPHEPALTDTALESGPIRRLTEAGQRLLVSGNTGTDVYAVGPAGALRKVAAYAFRHWATDFVFDHDAARLYSISQGGRVELWASVPHRLDRGKFADLLRLEYRPPRSAASPDRDVAGPRAIAWRAPPR